jgi:hypothetical protein
MVKEEGRRKKIIYQSTDSLLLHSPYKSSSTHSTPDRSTQRAHYNSFGYRSSLGLVAVRLEMKMKICSI